MRHWMMAAAIAVLGTAGWAAPVRPWSDLVVFGDSLSDAGNVLGLTATDGQTWAGQLGARPWISGGTNFAYLGAQAATNLDLAPDFAAQRVFYRNARRPLGPDPLAVVWFGGNELRGIADAADAPLAIGRALTAIGTGVGGLAASGLTRVILPNLPDLSRIPANVGLPALQRAGIAAATAAFNDGLAQVAAGLRLAGLDARVFDTAGAFEAIYDDPRAFGFDPAKVTQTCLRGAISCDGFVFWDPIHPTAATHALIADGIVALAQPAPIPLPATIWLLAGGLGGAVAIGRRRRAAA